MFVGRNSELKFLESHYRAQGSRILVLYGRKGVGKTTIVREFAQGRNCAYYAARSCSEREQRYQWSRELAAQGYFMEGFPSYESLFETCLSSFNAFEGKPILFLDEFQHFVKADPEFMTSLIRFTEKRGAARPILVVLCSSASGWVENSMISKMGKSAASIHALLKVREMKFQEIVRLFPGYSTDDTVRIYAALGGNPGLWNSFSEQFTAKENMILSLLSPESRLYGEMAVYMAEELREPAVYNTLLATMASGLSKLNDLYIHTGFSRAKISVYLKNLMELDLVEKVSSYESGGYENTQKGIYRICNPYVHFYYRFLYPNKSALMNCDAETFYDRYVEPYYQEFMEGAYQKICREALLQECSQVGEWLGKNGTIDIVARKESGELIAGICRYAVPVSADDHKNLTGYLRMAKLTPDAVYLYAEAGVADDMAEIARQEAVYPKKLFGSEKH